MIKVNVHMLCDPNKNTKCNKSFGCYETNRGDGHCGCNTTTDIECAKDVSKEEYSKLLSLDFVSIVLFYISKEDCDEEPFDEIIVGEKDGFEHEWAIQQPLIYTEKKEDTYKDVICEVDIFEEGCY